MAKFVWQDGTLVSKAKVEIGGTIYEVDPEEYSGSTPLSASNLNAMVDSTYSDLKDYADEKQTYSTEEIVIGTYLGKPLYRKVITGNLSMSEIQHGLSNFVLRNCYGMFYNSNSGKYFPVPSVRPAYPEYAVGLIVGSTAVQLERATNVQQSYMTIEIVLEYTKTTDEVTE